jgi:NTP pyrophosphatase (non-canonical NTP hydrolase)
VAESLFTLKPGHLKVAGQVLTSQCHGASVAAGWWVAKDGTPVQDNPYAFSNKLALIHSEVSEAMEGDRKSLKDDHLPNRDMREVELADAVIRIFDLAGAYGMDLGSAIAEKMAYNQSRADHQPAARAAAGGKVY